MEGHYGGLKGNHMSPLSGKHLCLTLFPKVDEIMLLKNLNYTPEGIKHMWYIGT